MDPNTQIPHQPGTIIQPGDAAPIAPPATTQPPVAQPVMPTPAVATTVASIPQPAPQAPPQAAATPPPTTGGPSQLNVEALRAYEQTQQANSSWQIIKSDPAFKKQLIIAVVLIVTVILAIVGFVLLVMVYLKASAKAKEQQTAANQSIFNSFATQNNFRVVQASELPKQAGHATLLEQHEALSQGATSQTPKILAGLAETVEPIVSGSLPGGMSFSMQVKHLPIQLEETADSPEMLGIHSSAFSKNIGGLSVGVGNSFNSNLLGAQSMRNALQGSSFYTVSMSTPTGMVTNDQKEITVSGTYSYLTLTVFVGKKLMPQFILQPLTAGFAVPLAPNNKYHLTLEGNFNQYFQVSAIKGYETELLQILEPDIMQNFMTDAPDLTIEFVGNQVTFALALRPYTNEVMLADAVNRLHSLATKYEPWLLKQFANWQFAPQATPFDLQLVGYDRSLIISQLNQVGSDHISWNDQTQNQNQDQAQNNASSFHI